MKTSENNDIEKMLQRFDALDRIETGPEWDKELFERIAMPKNHYAGKNGILHFAAFVIVFIVLNVSLIYRSGKEENSTVQRAEMLNTISDQLLIQSVASK